MSLFGKRMAGRQSSDINCMANGGYIMHRSSFLSALILVLVLFAAGADAQKARFAGSFINEDPDTRGLTRLTLMDNDIVNVWGKCHPTDCNWGEEAIVAYAPGVESDVQRSAKALSAIYVQRHAVNVLIIKPLKDDRLRVDVFTRFTDRSGRSAYTMSYVLVREAAPAY